MLAEHAETTFVVTNNHFEGKGVVNALQLIRCLRQKSESARDLAASLSALEAIADEPSSEPTLFPLPPNDDTQLARLTEDP